ncbi:MAG: branched-chain amino acid ABC transporter permease [Nevskia sp.]|jgi:branched-chain amino acid transport system permease protein|nr:branched-chain amino acid ABC transporter permease [Nevskia sp.]
MKNRMPIVLLVLAVLGCLAPLAGLYPVFLMKGLCFALFACAFNLLIGYTGLLSFGHAAFFGTAGYVAGHFVKVWGWSPELGIILGAATSAGLGWLIGGLAIRRQGIYFAMITLALSQMLYFVCLQVPVTGAEDGMQGIPRGHLFGFIDLSSDLTLYYVVLAIFLAGYGLLQRVVNSPFGQVLKAIRENESRVLSLGYDVDRHKLLAFVLSAGLAGVAGATKTIVLGFETLTDVSWEMSGEVVLMTLVGGMGTLLGPVVGAFVIVSLQNYLADKVGAWVQVIIGSAFVLCVLALRKGIVGTIAARLQPKAINA